MRSGTPAPEDRPGPALRSLTWLALGLFGLSLLLAVASDRALFADGAYLFIKMLEDGHWHQVWSARRFADLLFQLPASLALWAGVTDLGLLRLLFNLGCFLPWPVALLLCWRLAPAQLWLALLACAVGYLNAALLAVGQHIVAHAFFWPALFALAFVRSLTPFAAAVLLLSALVLLRSYETLLLLGPLLALLALWRAAEGGAAFWRRLVCLSAAGLFIAATVIAQAGRETMRRHQTYDDFIEGLLHHAVSPPWTLRWSLVVLLLVALAFWLPGLRQRLRQPAGLLALSALVLLWGLWPLLSPGSLEPKHQHTARFVNLLVPLVFFFLALALAWRPAWFAAGRSAALGLTAAALIAQSLWQIGVTLQWQGYLGTARGLLATREGPVPVSETPLGWSRGDQGQSYRFTWGWALPSLSYALAPRDRVQALLYSSGEPWQPFDPLDPAALPDLARYGIDDSPYRAALTAEEAAQP